MASNHESHDWVELHFPAMQSPAHVALRGNADDMRWARREIERLEYRWSTAYGCSDVARCNRAAGRSEVAVAGETLDLLDAAIAWWLATDGWFDPTASERPDAPAPGCAGIVVDHATNSVFLPEGVGIDLGGIGKGAAADRVVAGLAARGVVAACVSLGGDVRAYGSGHDGAIVTSTSGRRHRVQCGRRNHLVDPTTGRAADSGLAAVVVTDHTTQRAEVLATAAFVAGRERGADLLARFGVDGWFIPVDAAA